MTATANTRVITADPGSTNAIKVTLGRNASLQNATVVGANGGGIYLNYGAQFYLEGGTIRNCSAVDGGGVYVDGSMGTMVMSAGTITRCTASGNGGGILLNLAKPQGSDETNPTAGYLRITGGTISRCSATNGAGVYLNGNKVRRMMFMSGGTITGNNATGTGGGIGFGDDYCRLYFSGASYVYGNTMGDPAGTQVACNVYLNWGFEKIDSKTVIYCTGLIRGASIGVYVPDTGASGAWNESTLYTSHGEEAKPFANYVGSNPRSMNLNYFVSDRDGYKGGVLDNQASSNKKIYWCKIYSLRVTLRVISDDAADSARSFNFTVRLVGNIGTSSETAASNFNGRYGDMTFVNGVATFTLPYEGIYYYTADLLPLGYEYIVTEEIPDELSEHFKVTWVDEVHGEEGMSTTTAGTTLKMDNESRFLYEVNFSNMHAVCKITDAVHGLLYTKEGLDYVPAVYAQLVTAFNRVNDSHTRTWYYLDGDYNELDLDTASLRIEMLIPEFVMEWPAALSLSENPSISSVVLTTADRHADDGFPYAGAGTARIICAFPSSLRGNSMITTDGALTLSNIILDGGSISDTPHSTTANGGVIEVLSGGSLIMAPGAVIENVSGSADGAGVYVASGGTMTMGNNTEIANITGSGNGAAVYVAGTLTMNSGSTIRDNASTGSGNGAAVYVANGGAMTMGTGASILGNTIASTGTGNGAGVYLAQGSALYLSGDPAFVGESEAHASGNIKNSTLTGQTNGTLTYLHPHQDIYIEGYSGTNASSLVVTGDLTGSAGSIWVWAGNLTHGKSRDQFAVMQGGTRSGVNVFRNARTDADSNNTTETYLFGVTRDGDSQYVYWNGPATLSITNTITGIFADTSDRFTYIITGLNPGVSYSYQRYVSANGTTWTAASNSSSFGDINVSADGASWSTMTYDVNNDYVHGSVSGASCISFTLSHNEKLDITLPAGAVVSVTETQRGFYRTSYVLSSGESVQSNTLPSQGVDADRVLAFTNRWDALSPSGVSFHVLPFVLLLVAGLGLFAWSALGKRRRKEGDLP